MDGNAVDVSDDTSYDGTMKGVEVVRNRNADSEDYSSDETRNDPDEIPEANADVEESSSDETRIDVDEDRYSYDPNGYREYAIRLASCTNGEYGHLLTQAIPECN